MKKLLQIVFIVFLLNPSFANSSRDSLENLLPVTNGKTRMELLAKLSRAYRAENTTKSIAYGEEHLELAKMFGDKKEEIKALNNLGIIFYHLGYYESTLEYFINILEITEILNDDEERSNILNNLGNLYDEIGDKTQAIEHYKQSLEIKYRLGDLPSIAITLSNLGYVYNEIGKTTDAYKYFREALKIDSTEGNIEGIFVTYNNLGLCFLKKGNFDSANYFLNQALLMEKDIDNMYDRADLYKNLAFLQHRSQNYDKAIDLYNTSLKKAQAVKARALVKDCYKGLAEIYHSLENYKLAFENFKKFTLINDSIFNENNSRRISSIESDYKMQKREREILLLKQEAAIKNLILEKNKQISYFLYGGFVLFVGLIVVLYQKYQFKTKANTLLKAQNDLIATKNLNITDSIYYAKGIQEAIMPDTKILKSAFNEYFILSKPRDIVNGDFFWFADKGDYFVLAVVDCTGHGVPGAFMNVMGNSLLNQIVIEKNIIRPAQILYDLNLAILNTLHQENFDRDNKDGMDIGVVLYHKPTKELIFSGAKHSLYLFKNNELQVVKGNIYSIGGNYYQVERLFEEHKIVLNDTDTFYLFTDGLIDQFGEKINKKFMGFRLRELLQNIQASTMEQQAQAIETAIMQWKGRLEQTDDILIIGVKV